MAVIATGQIPQAIANAASQYGVPPQLALEVAIQESGLNQSAVSPAGAIGIFQLMPATAAGLGVDPTDAAQNIQGGVRYLGQLLSRYGGDQSKALAAYNWGPSNVDAAVSGLGSNWLSAAPSETQNYVASILTATGQNYAASVTPASIANGASSVAAAIDPTTISGAVADFTDSPAGGSLLLLTAIALGAYLLSDLLFD